jgi:hypothetical protein
MDKDKPCRGDGAACRNALLAATTEEDRTLYPHT